MSTENEYPSEFSTEDCVLMKLSDSNTVTHRVEKHHKMLYVALSTKHKDCLLTATATVQFIGSLQPAHRASMHISQSGSLTSMNLRNPSVIITKHRYEPGKKDAYVDMLHRKDMKGSIDFCDLTSFGEMITDKGVRERAIQERIEAIKNSKLNQCKFEEQF